MHTIKKLKRTIVFILKLALFASLFGIFFGIFGINNPWLFNLSRTTGVTMVTFVVLGIALMQVYGGYAIGTQKSRPIVHSMALATIITDLVTHLQLSIMNTSEKNNAHFVYETPERLLLVILLQLVVIVFFAYFGNYIYFSLEPPEKCCVISSSRQSLGNIIPKIDRFRKQYEVDEIIRYDDPKVLDVIARNDTVFLYDVPIKERIHLIEYCYQKQKNIYYNFEMIDVVSQGAKYVTLDDKSMVMYTAKDLTMEQRIAKRVMDLALSLVGLIVASPIMLVCAIAIKAEDGGHVFYKQKRLTKYGRVFEVYKFRTMKEENSIHKSVTENDDRITKVGKYLRKFRVDELPQLLNILKGDMTIVGPRPEMLENVEKYTEELPEFSYRLRMKAGLTGLAQISGKYNTSPKDKLVMDLMYIEHYSIWMDIKLIFQTITVFLKASESTEAFGSPAGLYDFDEDREPQAARPPREAKDAPKEAESREERAERHMAIQGVFAPGVPRHRRRSSAKRRATPCWRGSASSWSPPTRKSSCAPATSPAIRQLLLDGGDRRGARRHQRGAGHAAVARPAREGAHHRGGPGRASLLAPRRGAGETRLPAGRQGGGRLRPGPEAESSSTPGMEVRYKNGYAKDKDADFRGGCEAFQPDLVLVALGVPAQEKLSIARHLGTLLRRACSSAWAAPSTCSPAASAAPRPCL